MLTYQVRPRRLRFSGRIPSFPADCVVRCHFLPLQPFGDSAEGGRTAVRAVDATILFDANTGESTITSSKPYSSIGVNLSLPSGRAHWRGSVFTLEDRFDNAAQLQNVVLTLYHHLPSVLAVVLADPPVVREVEGEVDGAAFRWELSAWRMHWSPRTEAEQAEVIAGSWDRLQLAGAPHRGRLLAALRYFHTACRLARRGSTPGEFMSEVLLNFAKTLEVLFPTGSRDAVRKGLGELGYSEAEIEAQFIPALALRNEVDVGHAKLAVLTEDDRRVIHAYTDSAEVWFRKLLERLIGRIERGEGDVVTYDWQPPGPEVKEIIRRLRNTLPKNVLGEDAKE